MPSFVKYDPSEQGINFTGRSQGAMGVGEAIGGAIKGLAKVGSDYLNTKDAVENKNARAAVNAAADELLSGVPENAQPYSDIVPDPGEANLPAGLKEGMTNFKRYAKAYNNGGTGSDLDIYSKMVTSLKQLKTRFPGQEDVLDAMFMSSLNSKPANTIRKELNSLLDNALKDQASKTDSKEKFYRQWASTNGEYIDHLGIKIEDMDFSNENQMLSIWTKVTKEQGADLSIKQEQARVTLDAANGTLQTKKVKELAQKEIITVMNRSMRAGQPEFDAFIKSRTEAASPSSPGGVKITTEEQQQIIASFRNVSANLRLMANATINNDFYKDKLVGTSDRNDVLSAVDGQLKIYDEMLSSSSYGLLGDVGRALKSETDMTQLKSLEGEYGTLPQMYAIGKNAGIDIATLNEARLAAVKSDQFLSEQEELGKAFVMTGVLTGVIPNMGKALETAQKDGASPKVIQSIINNSASILTTSDNPALIAKIAKSVYQNKDQDQLLATFGPVTQREVFNRFTSPQVMAKLKGTPEYALAEEWTKTQFNNFHRQDMETLIANQDSIGKDIAVAFDPTNSTFKPEIIVSQGLPFSNPSEPGGGENIKNNMAWEKANKVKAALVSMNADLMKVHEIVKGGTSGLDPAEETKVLLFGAGLGNLKPELRDKLISRKSTEADQAEKPRKTASISSDHTTALETISNFEGFKDTAYWDSNGWRTGFGSDTITLADGTIEKVTKNSKVSKQDALRDLSRRVGEFQAGIINDIGGAAWNKFNPKQQAALSSIAYNYGELPSSVRVAIESGDEQIIAQAILALQSHNKGINKKRRMIEAESFLNQ